MALHTLLLVDPSPKTQAEIRAMFADEPIAVEVAEDGQQALEQIEAHRPNVVLACAKAAAVDGYAIAHFVARRPNLRSVTVLLLVARSAVDERRIHESGAKGFLTKPLRAAVVVPCVREALVRAPAKRSKAAASTKRAAAPKAAARRKAAAPKAAPEVVAPLKPEAPAHGEFDSAFDAIDTTMKAPPRAGADAAFLITPAALAKIVQEAVARAIESHERTPLAAPSQGREATGDGPTHNGGRGAAPARKDAGEITRLQRDMGFDDLSFDQAPPSDEAAGLTPAPVEAPAPEDEGLHRLQHEMGLDELALPEELLAAPLEAPPAKPSLADVALEDATAAAFGLDRPDESIEWLQEQLHLPGEPDEDDQAAGGWADAGHTQFVEPIRQAVAAVRARLSMLMRPRASRPTPHEQAQEPEPRTVPVASPPASNEPDEVRFTFDPLPPLPPSLLRNPEKQ